MKKIISIQELYFIFKFVVVSAENLIDVRVLNITYVMKIGQNHEER